MIATITTTAVERSGSHDRERCVGVWFISSDYGDSPRPQFSVCRALHMQAAHYDRPVKPRILILGAGFGGLELATTLSEDLGDDVEVTLIDKSDAFVFGYSKLDVMFGRTTPDAVRLPYRHLAKPGVRLLRETVTAIDPVAKAVTTDAGVHEADHLVVALGADYDFDATPGPRGLDRVLLGRRAPSGWRSSCRSSRWAAPWWACAARRTSARRHRARRRSSCTTSSSARASAATARSRSWCRFRRRSRRRRAPPLRCSAPSPSAASASCRAARSPPSTSPGTSPSSPTARRCRTTSSSACRSTARRTSSSRAGWPSTATSRSTGARSRRGSRTCTRSATSRRSGRRRRASSRSARRGSSPAR